MLTFFRIFLVVLVMTGILLLLFVLVRLVVFEVVSSIIPHFQQAIFSTPSIQDATTLTKIHSDYYTIYFFQTKIPRFYSYPHLSKNYPHYHLQQDNFLFHRGRDFSPYLLQPDLYRSFNETHKNT